MEATPYFFVALSLFCWMNTFPSAELLEKVGFRNLRIRSAHAPLGAVAHSPPTDLSGADSWRSAVGRFAAYNPVGRGKTAGSFPFSSSPPDTVRFAARTGDIVFAETAGAATANGKNLEQRDRRKRYDVSATVPVRLYKPQKEGSKLSTLASLPATGALLSTKEYDSRVLRGGEVLNLRRGGRVTQRSGPYHTADTFLSKKNAKKRSRYAVADTTKKVLPAAAVSLAAVAREASRGEDVEEGGELGAVSAFEIESRTQLKDPENAERDAAEVHDTYNAMSLTMKKGSSRRIHPTTGGRVLAPWANGSKPLTPSKLYSALSADGKPRSSERKLDAAGPAMSLTALEDGLNYKEVEGSFREESEADYSPKVPENLDRPHAQGGEVPLKAATMPLKEVVLAAEGTQERSAVAHSEHPVATEKTAAHVVMEGAAAAANKSKSSAASQKADTPIADFAAHGLGEKQVEEAQRDTGETTSDTTEETRENVESPICGAWQTIQGSPFFPSGESSAAKGLLGLSSTPTQEIVAAARVPTRLRERITGHLFAGHSAAAVAAVSNADLPNSPTCQWLPRHGIHVIERRTYTENPNLVDVERLEFPWTAGCVPEHLTRRWVFSGTWESTAVANGKNGSLKKFSVKIDWSRVQVHSDRNTLNHILKKKAKTTEKDVFLLENEKHQCGKGDAWLSPSKTLPLDIVDFCVRPQKQLYVSVPRRELVVMPQQAALSHYVYVSSKRRSGLEPDVLNTQDGSGNEKVHHEETEDLENITPEQCVARMQDCELAWKNFLSKHNIWARQLCSWSLLRQSCPLPPKTSGYAGHYRETGHRGEKRACVMPPLTHTIYREGDVDFLEIPQFPFGKEADTITLRKVSGCELYGKIQRNLEEEFAR